MKSGKLGVVSALLASACCVLPAIALLLGVSTFAFGTFVGKYHWYLQGAAIAILIWAWWAFVKERRKLHGLASEMRHEGLTKGILIVASVMVAAFTGFSSYTAIQRMTKSASPSSTPGLAWAGELVSIPVKGMTCFSCEQHVEGGLKKLSCVVKAKASTVDENVIVQCKPGQANMRQMVQAVNATGYAAGEPQIIRNASPEEL